MNFKKIKIKVFSDTEDISSVNSALRQIELESVPIAYTNPNSFAPEEDTIFILQIDSLDSKLLAEVVSQKSDLKNKVIVVIRNNNALLVSSILKMGFYDIFVFPYELLRFTSYIKEVINNGLFKTSQVDPQTESETGYNIHSLVGKSENFIRVVNLAKKVSQHSSSNILLLGATGTGKGLFAKAIHNYSKHFNEPFVDIVCTAIPETLLESELFGYEVGAFTNARTRKLGLFELAGRGTLFLDEIGDMSINLQSKILRAIEKKVIKRLGGVTDIPIHARIISATNRNIEQMVSEGSFRRDLFHRLNVVTIELPELKERDEDVIILANYFIDQFNKEFGKSVKNITKELRHFFIGYPWPGNVRELKNAIERAVLLSDDGELTLSDFNNLILSVPVHTQISGLVEKLDESIIRLDVNFATTNLKRLTKYFAAEVVKKVGGNKSQAAKLLGISRPKLDTLLSKGS